MPDRPVDRELVADSLELLSVFRRIDDPGLRRTIISLAYALRPSSYGEVLWSKVRLRKRPGHMTTH